MHTLSTMITFINTFLILCDHFRTNKMGLGRGMAQAWMRAIQGYVARQKMAHLSKSCWKYLGKRAYEHSQEQQKGRGTQGTRRWRGGGRGGVRRRGFVIISGQRKKIIVSPRRIRMYSV